MRHTSEDALGRRRFQLLRERAVEEALERIQNGPISGWATLSCEECTRLRDLLGELWIHIGRERWESYSFSSLTCREIRSLLALHPCHPGRTISRENLAEMDAILSHTRSPEKQV